MMYTFINFLEIKYYYLQQNIYILFSSHLDDLNPIIFILLFISGVLTSINPCLISLLPLTLSSISNHNINKQEKIAKNNLIYGLISSIVTLIFFILLFNKYYQKLVIHIPIFSSLLIIIVGLNLLQILEFSQIFMNIRLIISSKFKINQRATYWLIGFTLGISSSSCSTPILATITLWLSNSGNFILALISVMFYLIGYTLPLFMLIYITINYHRIIIITKIWNYILPVSGSIILGVGIFSLLANIFI